MNWALLESQKRKLEFKSDFSIGIFAYVEVLFALRPNEHDMSSSFHLMAKPKNRKLVTSHAEKSSGFVGPNFNDEGDMPGDDSWVVVKKQRVTIWIPPLPVGEEHTARTQKPSQPQAMPRKAAEGAHLSNEKDIQKQPCDRPENPVKIATEKNCEIVAQVPSAQQGPKVAVLVKPPHRPGLVNPDGGSISKSRKFLRYSSTSKRNWTAGLLPGPVGFPDGAMLINRRMQASNVERKLRLAGGLNNWLMSLGLDQFVRIFRGKKVHKFQLVNLTMKKLKDMGANAVGPRRKLMHAIESLSAV
ncbi:Sterile alpha motif domain [Dillenia turbinata]|uniref:Sterile alpha motif domain n=1 Tax=Dillenia turbinata TaxID=194707 RepID=A0AAN8ZLQ4_9MAGN